VSRGSRTPTGEECRGRSPSRRPRGGRGGGKRLVVERVVKKIASAGSTNYATDKDQSQRLGSVDENQVRGIAALGSG
jgi:hypothetical protein